MRKRPQITTSEAIEPIYISEKRLPCGGALTLGSWSMEDSLRYHLICQALHGSDKFVEILCQWGHSLSRAMREKEVQA